MPKNIETADHLAFDWSDPQQAVDALFDFTIARARSAARWYWDKKRLHKTMSQWLKSGAILGGAIGALIPLVATALGDPGQSPLWGYVLLAFAGACLSMDRFFGFSTTWMRYVTSATAIETELSRFELDWARLKHAHGGKAWTGSEAGPFLARASELLTRVRAEIERETEAWKEEFRANLAALAKEIEEQRLDDAPGAIELEVDCDAVPEGGIRVLLDGDVVQTLDGTRAGLRPVFPGQHQVAIRAEIDGRELTASAIVAVSARTTTPVTLSLRSPAGG